ncbi:MAG: transcriptional repressor NrdR [Deltaproteobacteria bacterium]|nr:transcriptional repressor NrdR [Deltaproteobacteria bacterium]
MRCPYCQSLDNRVMDSRFREGNNVVRRRRKCSKCGRRFTTYERVGDMHPAVVKKDGRREDFDRDKILAGVRRACEKLPVSVEQVEEVVYRVERRVCDMGEKEVSTRVIGDQVMSELRALSDVAYVRFASVYMVFNAADDFEKVIHRLRKAKDAPAPRKSKDAPAPAKAKSAPSAKGRKKAG